MKSDIKEKADKLKAYLEDHKCTDVVVIDMENECSWTDAFVIVRHRHGLLCRTPQGRCPSALGRA